MSAIDILTTKLRQIAVLHPSQREAALRPLEVEHYDQGTTTELVMLWQGVCREAGVDPMEHLNAAAMQQREGADERSYKNPLPALPDLPLPAWA